MLVEAKAHETELKEDGRQPKPNDSEKSRENHARITNAVAEACDALPLVAPGIGICADKCYQLSNRIAFAWKLATLGIPVALVYLGFVGDTGMDGGFRDAEHWRDSLAKHAQLVFVAA